MTWKMASSQQTIVDTHAIFHELSPKLILLVRAVNAVTLVIVVITFILCFVQGHKNGSYYLLVCNLIISAIVSSVVNWWYKSGDLGSEKYWFVILVGVVIMFQCLSTDIFVFKEDTIQPITTTVAPINTSTVEWSTMISPSSHQF